MCVLYHGSQLCFNVVIMCLSCYTSGGYYMTLYMFDSAHRVYEYCVVCCLCTCLMCVKMMVVLYYVLMLLCYVVPYVYNFKLHCVVSHMRINWIMCWWASLCIIVVVYVNTCVMIWIGDMWLGCFLCVANVVKMSSIWVAWIHGVVYCGLFIHIHAWIVVYICLWWWIVLVSFVYS